MRLALTALNLWPRCIFSSLIHRFSHGPWDGAAGQCCHAAMSGGGDGGRPLAAGALRKVVGCLELTTPSRRGGPGCE
eukprot:9698309-Prorocentrum_lima.AAC.1